MRYVEARFKKEIRDKTYRFYVTECLKALTSNTARAERIVFKKSYVDLLHQNRDNNSVDNKTKEEVIDHIREKITSLTGG